MTNLLRRVPATTAYLGALVALAVIAGVPGRSSAWILRQTSTGFEQVVVDHRWWTPLTSLFFLHNPLELLIVLPVAALCLGFAEYRMGTARLIISGLVAVSAGTLAGIALQGVGVARGEMWSRHVQQLGGFDPLTLAVAVLLAATAFTGTIWRNRIRVVTITTCLVFLLYSGAPADLYRLLAAMAGLAIGHAFRPTPPRRQWSRSSHHEMRVRAAAVVAITAVGPVLTLVSGRRFGLLAPLGLLMSGASPSGNPLSSECDALNVTHQCLRDLSLIRLESAGPVVLAVLPLIALLVAALGLARGRRLAAWLSIGVNVGLAGLAIYYFGFLPLSGTRDVVSAPNPHYWEITLSLSASAVVPLLIAAYIARNLRHFPVRAPAHAVRRYVTTVAVSWVSLATVYLAGGWLLRGAFSIPVSFNDLLADLPERFIPITFLRDEMITFTPDSPLTGALYNWIGPVFWAIVILGALSTYFDAGVLNHAQGLPRVRALLSRGGGGYLSPWATWSGNSYWFSDDGRASVAYRVLAGVAITTSEPIGDADAAHDAIDGFARFCDDNGWIPVFYAIHESFVPAVRKMGWRLMVVGEEAVIRPAEWTTAGKGRQDIRSSINRAERLGVRSVWTTYQELPEEWQQQIEAISNQWIAGKALPEMGFTLGSIEELRSPEVGILIACDTDNRILGVTSWMPSFRDGSVVGWTLDFMRRTPNGMNGVMEFLIARAAERFRDQGADFMSLSTAPLATTLPEVGTAEGASGRILARIGKSIEPVYGFRSLFEFKKKFQPELHPIYLAYPDALGLPAIGLALARAYLPMLSLRQGLRFVRSRPGRTLEPTR
jgi:phosphatidylglycerol lysyltransferase